MEDAGNPAAMRSMTTEICHVQCYMLGLTSKSGELCFSNYLQYKTKINEQLCSGVALQWRGEVGKILTNFVNFPPFDNKMRKNKIGYRTGYFPFVISLLRTLQSKENMKFSQAETSQLSD